MPPAEAGRAAAKEMNTQDAHHDRGGRAGKPRRAGRDAAKAGSDRADVAGGLRGRSDEAACGPSRRSDLPGHPHAGHGRPDAAGRNPPPCALGRRRDPERVRPVFLRAKGDPAGAIDYITKPYTEQAIRQVVERVQEGMEPGGQGNAIFLPLDFSGLMTNPAMCAQVLAGRLNLPSDAKLPGRLYLFRITPEGEALSQETQRKIMAWLLREIEALLPPEGRALLLESEGMYPLAVFSREAPVEQEALACRLEEARARFGARICCAAGAPEADPAAQYSSVARALQGAVGVLVLPSAPLRYRGRGTSNGRGEAGEQGAAGGNEELPSSGAIRQRRPAPSKR